MKVYCVGFIFTPEFRDLLLIQKKRPEWQAGYLNGIGGKVERDETPVFAMTRETMEETGLIVPLDEWRPLARLVTSNPLLTIPEVAIVDFFFTTVSSAIITSARDRTDEKLIIIRTRDIQSYKTIPNLQWLVPLAAHFDVSLMGTTYSGPIHINEQSRC